MTFQDRMEAYALDPTAEHLEGLHRTIMDDPSYDPLATITAVTAPLVRSGDHRGVLEALWAQMPGILLSPAAHMHLSLAHSALGDEASALRERRFALLAMRSIRDGADGSEGAPYPVLRVEDEYAVLEADRARSRAQSQIALSTGDVDVHTLADDSTVWFRLLWRRPRADARTDR